MFSANTNFQLLRIFGKTITYNNRVSLVQYPQLISVLRSEEWSVFVVAIFAATQWITNAQTEKVQYEKRQQNNTHNQIQQQKDENPETT